MKTGFRSVLVLTAAAALLLAGGPSAAAATPIIWRGGAENLPAATAARVEGIAQAALRDGQTHVVVQFARPVDAELHAAAAARGLTLLRYLGSDAFFAALCPAAGGAALAELPGLAGLSAIAPKWKLHPALRAGQIPPWAQVGPDADGPARVALYVLFHGDVDLSAGTALLATNYGAFVRSELRTLNGVVLEAPSESLAHIACEDTVQWVEPALPELSGTNDGARALTGADLVHQPPYELDGQGVTVLVFDGGAARPSHVDFESRLTIIDSSSVANHATHVAGTIGGAGIANHVLGGMAPGTTLLSAGLQVGGGPGFLYTDPGDLENDYYTAISQGGALIANNSIGSNVEANGFDCAWQGDYGVTDALIDEIVRGGLGAPFRVIWSAGNERSGSRCDVEGFDDYYSIAPPSGAKNHISVGAVYSNSDTMTTFSSWGPTDDGRLKPDVCGPGSQTGGDYGITSCSGSSDTGYLSLSGTSMSSPVVCGLAALVLQDFQQQFPGQGLPRNSTLKALFAHSATDLGNEGPDYQFGYGSVRIAPAIELLRAGAFCENVVAHQTSYLRTVTVSPDAPALKVTLAWDDVPAAPNVSPALVNDLDLRVTGPAGTRFYPWTLDPLDPAAAATRAQEDHLNNIEQVYVPAPAPGEWTIEVYGYNVPHGPQPFSLVGEGAVNIAAGVSYPDGRPEVMPPRVPFELPVRIAVFGQELVPGTAQLHLRTNGGEWSAAPLIHLGDGIFSAAFPPLNCGDLPEYYISAETSEQGLITDPPFAPTAVYTYALGAWSILLADDFEEDRGWTIDPGALSGDWERADPEQVTNLGVITQPGDDHTPDPGHFCYVTGAAAGAHGAANDVDGGPSHLISPVLHLDGADGLVSYWRWFHISMQMDDRLVVSLSIDGLEWITVEEVSRSAEEWVYAEWRVSDFVPPAATVQVRFTVNDTDPGSLMEALVDDFTVQTLGCAAGTPGDTNCDGAVNALDINPFVLAMTNPDEYETSYPDCDLLNADCDQNGLINALDINPFVRLLTGG